MKETTAASTTIPNPPLSFAIRNTTDRIPVTEHQAELSLPPGPAPFPDMVWIPGGTFHMGSETHYPEERPVHRVTVDGFWMDRTPVTNASFQRFVAETRHVTFAEMAPNAADYPGAKKALLHP